MGDVICHIKDQKNVKKIKDGTLKRFSFSELIGDLISYAYSGTYRDECSSRDSWNLFFRRDYYETFWEKYLRR